MKEFIIGAEEASWVKRPTFPAQAGSYSGNELFRVEVAVRVPPEPAFVELHCYRNVIRRGSFS